MKNVTNILETSGIGLSANEKGLHDLGTYFGEYETKTLMTRTSEIL